MWRTTCSPAAAAAPCISGNVFSASEKTGVEAVGTLGGSVWLNNALDLPMDLSQATDAFGLVR